MGLQATAARSQLHTFSADVFTYLLSFPVYQNSRCTKKTFFIATSTSSLLCILSLSHLPECSPRPSHPNTNRLNLKRLEAAENPAPGRVRYERNNRAKLRV